MMNKMIVANLVHRPIRSLISIVAIALEVTLILLIVGLCLGLLNDSKQRQAGIGADVIVMPPGSSFIVGLTGAPMSIKVGNVLAKLPHVASVAPVVTQVSTAGALEVIAGIDLKSYESLGGPFRYIQGGPFQSPGDVLVDDLYAKAKHVKLGQTIEILNHPFRVAGIVEQGKGARKFLQIDVLQDLIGVGRGWAIGGFRQDAALDAAGVGLGDLPFQSGRNEDVAGGQQQLLVGDRISLGKAGHRPVLGDVFPELPQVKAGRVEQAALDVAGGDDFHSVPIE